MMRFMSSFKVFSMSSSMDWSGGITVGDLIVRIKKKKKGIWQQGLVRTGTVP